jgi:hypothetical protein
MSMQVVREQTPQTNGDPDKLIEEATEVLLVESDPGWRVLIEHFGCDNLIHIECESHEQAVALIDRIESCIMDNRPTIRVDSRHLVSLDHFRQAWIDQPHGGAMTTTSPQ